MDSAAAKATCTFAWQDYRTWPDGERWELIGGEPFAMSPSPTDRHQLVCGALFAGMASHFRGKPCRVVISPVDVRLSDVDVVQPDILVVCAPGQFRGTHIEGPPALVVEVLSPSSELHDRTRKLELYARCGVKEYWLVRPYPSAVEILLLDGPGYRIHKVCRKESTLLSPSFSKLRLRLARVFDFPIAPEERIDEIRESPAPYTPGWRPRTAVAAP
jgi:Uma2 family endonuclease